jgi:hypothetical protein
VSSGSSSNFKFIQHLTNRSGASFVHSTGIPIACLQLSPMSLHKVSA